MIDYSNITNVSGNAGRGAQQPSNAFSSMSNLFQRGQGGGGTGSAPMNLMPQNEGAQPGANLPGFLQMLSRAFGQGSGFQDYMGSSWRQSPLGQMMGGGQQGAVPSYLQSGDFGNSPSQLAQRIVEQRQRRGPR